MTYQELTEAIAARVSAIWPERMLYRDFCPVDFKRPSGFLYVTQADMADANLGLVEWTYEAELALFAATNSWSAESTEALRADQLAVLQAFGGPAIRVGDRSVVLTAGALSPGPGEAYVRFSASWLDSRPGYVDEDTAPEEVSGVPRMENFQLNVGARTGAPGEKGD